MRNIYAPARLGAFAKASLLALCFYAFVSSARAQYAGTNLSYDGTDDYLTMPNGIVSTVTGDFTVECYVYWRGGSNSFPRILEFGNNTSNFLFLTAALPFGSGGPRFAIVVGGTVQEIDATTVLTTNAWHHIAVTVDDATDVGTIYIDGVASGTRTGFTFHLSDLGVTTGNWLGGRGQFTDPYFNGNIEELRISNVVRTIAPMPMPMQFTPDANTRALYHFNEGMGQTTADASGNNAVATLGSNPAAADANDPTWIFASILPVRLTEFSATATSNGKAVDVRWTASLDAASSFVVERSSNGTSFTAIGTINAANGALNETFSFRDANPLTGRSYYRLRSTEAGQSAVYSRTAAVTIGGKGELVIYPNPVRGNLINIELAQPFTGDVELVLSNAAGNVVFRQKVKATGRKDFQVTRNGSIPAGSYLLEVITDGSKQSKLIICQ